MQNPVGEGEDAVVVGDHHERAAALPYQVRQQVHDQLPVLRVQRGGRLVGQENGRVAGQSAAMATRWHSPVSQFRAGRRWVRVPSPTCRKCSSASPCGNR